MFPIPGHIHTQEVDVKYVVNWPARLEEMAAFVGLTEYDRRLIQESAPIIMEHAEALTDAVYDNFLKFPPARKFFLDENGEVDEERLTKRKHTLIRWLRGTISYTLDESFAVSLLATGISHSHPPTHREHLGPVPSKYMIGTMSFTQTVIAELLCRKMDDTELALGTSVSWNKLLMVELDILLASYLTDPAA